jgi:hypothetical protein
LSLWFSPFDHLARWGIRLDLMRRCSRSVEAAKSKPKKALAQQDLQDEPAQEHQEAQRMEHRHQAPAPGRAAQVRRRARLAGIVHRDTPYYYRAVSGGCTTVYRSIGYRSRPWTYRTKRTCGGRLATAGRWISSRSTPSRRCWILVALVARDPKSRTGEAIRVVGYSAGMSRVLVVLLLGSG